MPITAALLTETLGKSPYYLAAGEIVVNNEFYQESQDTGLGVITTNLLCLSRPEIYLYKVETQSTINRPVEIDWCVVLDDLFNMRISTMKYRIHILLAWKKNNSTQIEHG